jgi:Flp pilus assembly protein CpaB
MRKIRGLLALALSLGLAFLSAKGVYWHLNKPQAQTITPVKEPVAEPVKPVSFGDAIPEGMRVFNIRVDEVSGISRQLRKGDTVDVVAVGDMAGKKTGKVARIVMQNAGVWSTDVTPSSAKTLSQRQDREWTVSLLVTPEQGTLLSAITASDRIRLLARGPRDDGLASVADTAYSTEIGAVGLLTLKDDLPAAIPQGMRAVTIETRDSDGICGIIRPGDRLDVIVTSPYSAFATGGDMTPGAEGRVTEFRMASRVLLQDVPVLTTETILSGGPEIDRPVKRVTLLVTLAEAEKLAVISDATKKSVIRLVSRGKDDHERVRTQGQNLADLMTRRREYHRIDVLKGTQMTSRTFYR